MLEVRSTITDGLEAIAFKLARDVRRRDPVSFLAGPSTLKLGRGQVADVLTQFVLRNVWIPRILKEGKKTWKNEKDDILCTEMRHGSPVELCEEVRTRMIWSDGFSGKNSV